MINAAIRGKLDCLGSEDALTAVVFGRLRYLEPAVLGEWFATARNHCESTRRLLVRNEDASIEFWPTLKDTLRGQGTVQPDVVIAFATEVMIVEAKLWSSKSGVKDGTDQLARQWSGVASHHGNRSTVSALLYVTPHVEPPTTELEESAIALGSQASSLWWLSWSSLAPILERQMEVGDRVSKLVAEDLLAYLREADVLRFRGWRMVRAWKHWRYRNRYWTRFSPTNPRWRYQ